MSKKLRYFVFSQKKDKTLTMNQFEKESMQKASKSTKGSASFL